MRILLVDEADTLRDAMLRFLQNAGYEVLCARGLGEVRQLINAERFRSGALDLCLVELVRQQGNGFSLASSLRRLFARRGGCKVVLLCDREQSTDVLWAHARGIDVAACRRLGSAVFLQQIAQVSAGSDRIAAADDGRPRRCRRSVSVFPEQSDRVLPRLSAEISTAIMQLCSAAGRINANAGQSAQAWLQNSRDARADIWRVLQFLPAPFERPARLVAAESPQAVVSELLALQTNLAAAWPGSVDESWLTGRQCCCARMDQLLLELESAAASAEQWRKILRHLLSVSLALRALRLPEGDALSAAWVDSWIMQQALMLHLPEYMTQDAVMRLRSTIMRDSDCLAGVAPGAEVAANTEESQYSELLVRLKPEIRVTGSFPVAMYRLHAELMLRPEVQALWRAASASCASAALGANLAAPTEQLRLIHSLQVVLDAPLHSEAALASLLAAEIFNPPLPLSTAGQVLLAGNMKLLPRPWDWSERLDASHPDVDLLIGELCLELKLLAEAASLLELSGIGALSSVLISVYQILQGAPSGLQTASVHRRLIRAHRELCRMLDEAAVWRSGHHAAGTVQTMLTLRDELSGAQAQAFPSSAQHYESVSESGTQGQPEWAHCLRLNQQIQQILNRHRTETIDRLLLRDLLKSQSALIRRQLAYQTSG